MLVGVERAPNGLGPDSFMAHAQQEIGFRVESGSWYFRFDFDVQAASHDAILPLGGYWRSPPWSEPAEKIKIGPPEWAMLQYSLDRFRFRGGIITSMIGLEDWDPWINAFPTRGLNYNVTPGRTIGLEAAVVLDSGHEIFAFGGCDVDWGDCFAQDLDGDGVAEVDPMSGLKFGVGVTAILDTYSTFSGLTAFPNIDYYLANLTGEVYAHEYLTIGYEGAAVLAGFPNEQNETEWYGSLLGGFTFNVLPYETIHPMFRAQGAWDPSELVLAFYPVYGGSLPDFMAGAGLAAKPFDSFKISVEGKIQHFDVGWVPGVYTGITFTPYLEPPTYTARTDPPPEPAAEARRGRQPPAPSALPPGVTAGRALAAHGRR